MSDEWKMEPRLLTRDQLNDIWYQMTRPAVAPCSKGAPRALLNHIAALRADNERLAAEAAAALIALGDVLAMAERLRAGEWVTPDDWYVTRDHARAALATDAGAALAGTEPAP